MMIPRSFCRSSRRLHRISHFHGGSISLEKEQEVIAGLPVEEIPDKPMTRTEVNKLYQDYDRTKFREAIEITMPDLGDTGNGKILQWYKEPGDFVEPDALICEIEVNAFTFQMQTEDEEVGLLQEICIPAGTSDIVKGQLLARILLLNEDAPEKV